VAYIPATMGSKGPTLTEQYQYLRSRSGVAGTKPCRL